MPLNNTLTDVPGIQVGHATDLEGGTGCTVILCPPKTVGGVDVRGGGPGTRETDLLNPVNHVNTVHAIVLSGGSAFGLATADGVMRYLANQDIGYKSISGFTIPIVPAAILFDLAIGKQGITPGSDMGYAACEAAHDGPVAQGNVGAGTGATIGKLLGMQFSTKAGIGTASTNLGGGLIVAALVAVNAGGDVLDEKGAVLGGVRQPPDGDRFLGAMTALRRFIEDGLPDSGNTVIGVVATNARLSKPEVTKMSQMAHDGIARAVNPAHTMRDGDTIFALATGEIPVDPSVIGAFAADVMAKAIRNGVRHATSLAGVRAWND